MVTKKIKSDLESRNILSKLDNPLAGLLASMYFGQLALIIGLILLWLNSLFNRSYLFIFSLLFFMIFFFMYYYLFLIFVDYYIIKFWKNFKRFSKWYVLFSVLLIALVILYLTHKYTGIGGLITLIGSALISVVVLIIPWLYKKFTKKS